MGRGKRSVAIDLKQPAGATLVLDLCAGGRRADRGLPARASPSASVSARSRASARNPALVYGRMTGFGQDGPLASAAGHDINYISIGGALGSIGREGQPPTPPLNLVGDFGGGGMLLVVGVLGALLHARGGGEGQVVDAAMVDGSALLMAPLYHRQPLATGPAAAVASSTRALRSTTSTRRPTASTCRSAPSSRSSTPTCWRAPALDPATPRCADGRRRLAARRSRSLAERLPHQDPRRVVRPARRHRRVRHARARSARGRAPPAQRRARGLRRGRRRRSSRAGTAVRPNAGRSIAWGPPAVGAHTDDVLDAAGLSPTERAELRAAAVIA